MSVQSAYNGDQLELTISIDGRFDFSKHADFRNAYEAAPEKVTSYDIDLSETSYLDSSALGMLLLLRDHVGGTDANIKISHCNDEVRKILEVSNFEQLFNIS